MRRRAPVIGSLLLASGVAWAAGSCGTTPDTSDASADVTPAPDTFVSEGGTSDVVGLDSAKGDTGTGNPPATWSFKLEHVGYADMDPFVAAVPDAGQGVCVAAEGAPGANVGTGPLTAAGTFVAAFSIGDAGPLFGLPKSVSMYNGLRITGQLSRVTDTTATYLHEEVNLIGANYFESAAGCAVLLPLPTQYGGAQRYHHTIDPVDVRAVDGLTSGIGGAPVFKGMAGPLGTTPGHVALGSGGQGNGTATILAGDAGPYPLAIDAVASIPDNNPQLVFAGRMAGPFAFDVNAPETPGTGYVVWSLDATTLAVKWVRVLGGTPLQDVSLGPTTAEATSFRAVPGPGTDAAFTLPFEGTLNLGTKTLTAPAGAQATAVISFDGTGAVNLAWMFPKGPASSGKLSRPSAVRMTVNSYVLLDTVWDTMQIGVTTVTATAGSDVVLAEFDASGNLTSYRLYGGPGDDEAYRVTGALVPNDYLILGHSTQSIDFGNGALTTSAVEGEIWVARVPQ